MMQFLKKRLFLGNLPSCLSQSQLEEKLIEIGDILSVQMKQRTDDCGNIISSFAFVDVETDSVKFESCFKRFKSDLWYNHKIKLELAKESFLDRLKREQNSEIPQNRLSNSNGNDTSSVCKFAEKSENDYRNIRHSEKKSPSCNDQSFAYASNQWEETNQKENKLKRSKLSYTASQGLEPDIEADNSENCNGPKLPVKCIEDGNIIPEKINDIETKVKRNGSLRMFTGTKIFQDLHFDNIFDEEKQDEKTANLSVSKSIVTEKASVTETLNEQKRSPMFPGKNIFSNLEQNNTNQSMPLHPKKRKFVDRGSSDKKPGLNDRTNSFEKKKKVEVRETVISSNIVKPECCKESNHEVPKERTRKKLEMGLLADEKRLNALGERKKVLNLQKEAVKKALSSVDLKTTSNKKIIFDIDEGSDGALEDEVPEGNDSVHIAKREEDKQKLFGDSSDDEETKDLTAKEFKIKPQFEGPKGLKLLAMQSHFANDSRFTLDERFLESGDEDERDSENRETGDDLDAERAHQLNILQEILGVDVTTTKPRKERVDKSNRLEMVRFDPTDPKHSKFIMKEEKKREEKSKAKDKKAKKKEEEGEQALLPMTPKERFFVVSDTLREALKKSNDRNVLKEEEQPGKCFSLLEAFGSTAENEEEERKPFAAQNIKKKTFHPLERNPFKYDSSDEDEDAMRKEDTDSRLSSGERLPKINQEHTSSKDATSNASVERFQFKEDDPRLKEGLEFFSIDKTYREMQEGFAEKRTDLKMIIKVKVRNNKRRKLPFRRKLGGAKRFKKDFLKDRKQ